MKFELNNLPRNASIDEVISEIIRVDSLVGKDRLIQHDFDKVAKISSSAVKRKFGSWEKALNAANIGHKYTGIKVSQKMRQQSKKLTNEQVLSELKRIARILKQSYVTQENLNSYSKIISASTIVYRFGSYENGLKMAGLENSPGYRGKYSNEEYYENLLNVWTKYERQPFLREMDEEPSKISSGAYENRFGNWRKALEAFVERMNQKENIDKKQTSIEEKIENPVNIEIINHINSSEDRRGISLGLRYKVLSRDKFKCIRCGTSPATNPTCRLHIDHIVPFSRGGKTIFENLQTLCKDCNLGKGNRHLE
jgi:hypothetical protein